MPLTVLLPVLAMLLWVAVVGSSAVGMYRALQAVTRPGQNATVHLGAFHETIPPRNFVPFAVNDAVLTHSHVLTAIYLPGALLQMPSSLAITVPEQWYPRRLDEWTLRCIMLPLLSLPAWWLVGLAMESLLGGRRLPWPALATGGLLCALFAALLVGSWLGAPGDAGGDWASEGLTLWMVLFALLPLAALRPSTARPSTAQSSMARSPTAQPSTAGPSAAPPPALPPTEKEAGRG